MVSCDVTCRTTWLPPFGCNTEISWPIEMPGRCAVPGCCKTNRDSVALHRFPKDPVLRQQWTEQVQHPRAEWKPIKSTVLCSSHFTEDCFEPSFHLAAQFGIKTLRKLKPNAIPTIFTRKRAEATQDTVASSRATQDTVAAKKRTTRKRTTTQDTVATRKSTATQDTVATRKRTATQDTVATRKRTATQDTVAARKRTATQDTVATSKSTGRKRAAWVS